MGLTTGASKIFQVAVNLLLPMLAKQEAVQLSANPGGQVKRLKTEVRVHIVAAFLIGFSSLAFLTVGERRGPVITIGTNGVAWALVREARKKKGQIERLLPVAKAQSHVQVEKAKQQVVVDEVPSAAPVKLRRGIEEQLQIALMNHDIYLQTFGFVKAPSFYRIKLELGATTTIEQLHRLAPTLKTPLGCSQDPIFTTGNGIVYCDIERPDREFIKVEDYLIDGFFPPGTPITLPMGVDINRKLLTASPLDPNTCHFIVAGTTGSGKSEALRAWIRWLTQWHPSEVQIIVVDPKRVTFADMEPMERVRALIDLTGRSRQDIEQMFPDALEAEEIGRRFAPWMPLGVIKDTTEAIQVYRDIVQQMHSRYEMFNRLKVKNIGEYNTLAKRLRLPLMPLIVAVVDEYFVLTATNDNKKSMETQLKELGAMARAAGICLVIATQQPRAEVLTPLIRGNMPARVCLNVASPQDAEIVLGMPGNPEAWVASALFGKGDTIVYLGKGVTRTQALYWDGKSLPPEVTDFGLPHAEAEVSQAAQPSTTSMPVAAPPRPEPAPPSEVAPPVHSPAPTPAPTPVPIVPSAVVSEGNRPRTPAEQYMLYRRHREADGSVNQFFVQVLEQVSYSAEDKRRFFQAIYPYLEQWIVELSATYPPEQIVTIVYGIRNTQRFQELFSQMLATVNQLIPEPAAVPAPAPEPVAVTGTGMPEGWDVGEVPDPPTPPESRPVAGIGTRVAPRRIGRGS